MKFENGHKDRSWLQASSLDRRESEDSLSKSQYERKWGYGASHQQQGQADLRAAHRCLSELNKHWDNRSNKRGMVRWFLSG